MEFTAATAWLQFVDEENYAASWASAGAYFQSHISCAEWVDKITHARGVVGQLRSRQFIAQQSATQLANADDGEYVIVQYQSAFSLKSTVIETLTLSQAHNGNWSVVGYYLN